LPTTLAAIANREGGTFSMECLDLQYDDGRSALWIKRLDLAL